MNKRILAGITLLVMGATGQPACAPAVRPSAAAPSLEVVHVAPPTGERDADRASILTALERVRPGGTVQFAPGTYLVGEIVPVTTPRVTLVGDPAGTTLRGCDPVEYEAMERAARGASDWSGYWAAARRCGMLDLTGGQGSVRNLTFEYTHRGVQLGCCMAEPAFRPSGGGYLIENNTFRYSVNGIRVSLASPDTTVIRNNTFINTFHAVSAAASHLHILDNEISAPEPDRVPETRYPGFAIGVEPVPPAPGGIVIPTVNVCEHNVIAGNRIVGHPDGILLSARLGTTCRRNVVRDNTIRVSRVWIPASRPHVGPVRLTSEADSTVDGIPLLLFNNPVSWVGDDSAAPGIFEDNLIEGNHISGARGLAMTIYRASRNRIVNNTISGVARRDPFPGSTLSLDPQEWRAANGSGIWVSPGSAGNEIRGNIFEDIAADAVVLEGDRNVVETHSASDAVRDLGSGNRVRASPAAREGFAPGADGVRLFYRVEGRGRDTVVVLHGGPSLGFAYLAPDLEPLGAEFTLLYYDQRGIGRSSRPDDSAELAVARHVEDLEALRRHFRLERLVLVGHSWGALLAARYATAYPDHVERMLFIDPMAPARTPYQAQGGARAQRLMQERLDSVQRARLEPLFRSWAEAEDPLAHCRAMYGILTRAYFQEPAGEARARGDFCAGSAEVLRSRPQADAAILGSLGDWDVRPLLARVDVPVLIVHGAGSAIPLEAMQAWARAFPNARLMVVPDAGHYLHVDRPEVFFPAVVEFLGGGWPSP